MNIKDIQKQLSDFADERDWDQFHNPKNLAMALSVEASELVEIFQWLTPEQAEEIMNSSESEHVKEEMADIMIYLIRMADKLNVDLEKAVADKIVKNAVKHPAKSQPVMDVMQKLANMAKEMRLQDSKPAELGLTPEEYAFYTILAENSSTQFLEDHKMKELIHLIVDIIRKNATVDWEKRDDVRAKLRLMVKKVLMKYGYPPDIARIEADRVLEQGELLASELSGN